MGGGTIPACIIYPPPLSPRLWFFLLLFSSPWIKCHSFFHGRGAEEEVWFLFYCIILYCIVLWWFELSSLFIPPLPLPSPFPGSLYFIPVRNMFLFFFFFSFCLLQKRGVGGYKGKLYFETFLQKKGIGWLAGRTGQGHGKGKAGQVFTSSFLFSFGGGSWT